MKEAPANTAPKIPAMDMVEVPKALLMRYAGKSWESVHDAANTEVVMRGVPYGNAVRQERRETWTPPFERDGKTPQVYLPLDHAWLRKVDGRAFLYLQNW